MPTEKPILFSGPMVRAILSGRKTVTRRVLKNQMLAGWGIADPAHPLATITSAHPKKGKFGLLIRREIYPDSGKFEHDVIPSPYGKPGDRLWVRETYGDAGFRLTYRADLDDGARCMIKKWTPAIHMFRKDSRILLEITAVRVERLQDITEQQAEAEGVERPENIRNVDVWDGAERELFNAMNQPRARFVRLWGDINGPESWTANPWVWVVEFKRINP